MLLISNGEILGVIINSEDRAYSANTIFSAQQPDSLKKVWLIFYFFHYVNKNIQPAVTMTCSADNNDTRTF